MNTAGSHMRQDEKVGRFLRESATQRLGAVYLVKSDLHFNRCRGRNSLGNGDLSEGEGVRNDVLLSSTTHGKEIR